MKPEGHDRLLSAHNNLASGVLRNLDDCMGDVKIMCARYVTLIQRCEAAENHRDQLRDQVESLKAHIRDWNEWAYRHNLHGHPLPQLKE